MTVGSPIVSPRRPNSAEYEWVPETRFGAWFQGSGIWTRYVVSEALEELRRLAGDSLPEAPLILDAGCGSGVAFLLIKEYLAPSRIIAIDIDPEFVAEAEVAATKVECPVEVLRGDVSNTGLADCSVDVIVCHQTLHHVSEQEETLGEFRRLLKPGGLLLLAESCQSFTASFLVRTLFRHPESNQRSADEYLAMVQDAGFEIELRRCSAPDPWWARLSVGLRFRSGLGQKILATQVCVSAVALERVGERVPPVSDRPVASDLSSV